MVFFIAVVFYIKVLLPLRLVFHRYFVLVISAAYHYNRYTFYFWYWLVFGALMLSSSLPLAATFNIQAAALAFLRVPSLTASSLINLLEASEALPMSPALQPVLKEASLATLWQEAPYIDFAGLGLLSPKVAQELHRLWPSIHPEQELEPYLTAGVGVLLWGDADYPALLAESHRPPACLFYKGNVAALNAFTNLAVVGTRQASDLGRATTQHLIEGLQGHPICIVSGLAEGIDTEAHAAALKAKLPTVAVYGCGLSQTYPARNKALAQAIVEAGGTLLSEFYLQEQPNPKHFPQRNRIIVGLSQAVVVVEAARKSGAMITAHMGLDENRSVCAVPWHPSHELGAGPLSLIFDGAPPVWEASHVLDILNERPPTGYSRRLLEGKTATVKQKQLTPKKEEPRTQQVSLPLLSAAVLQASKPAVVEVKSSRPAYPQGSLEALIIQALGQQTLTLDELARLVKQSIPELMVALTMLSLEGDVEELSGARVRLARE
jgi:DNA processing protein